MCKKMNQFKTIISLTALLVSGQMAFTQVKISADSEPVSVVVTDLRGPGVEITNLDINPQSPYEFAGDRLMIVAQVKDNVGVKTVLLNNEELTLDDEGFFQKALDLDPGMNKIGLTAIDINGNSTEITYTVISQSIAARTNGNSYLPPIPMSKGNGKYYALIIGINDYQDSRVVDLDKPVKDAERFYNVLTTRYTFEKDNAVFLKNPTRADIIKAMDNLSNQLNEEDNLLIFYAGHGYWDEKKSTGYWLPSDAEKDHTTNWLRNSTIQGFIEDIPTRHTLLIADACFSGGIFKTRKAFSDAPDAVEHLYNLKSRKGMTSGMLKEVPDQSVFIQYLVKKLENNEEKYTSSLELFYQLRVPVMNNSNNTPQYGTIQNTGDEGGEFIFIRK